MIWKSGCMKITYVMCTLYCFNTNDLSVATFLVHLSRMLKRASLIENCPLSIVVIGIFIVNDLHLYHLLRNYLVNFNQPAQSIIGLREFNFLQMKGHTLFEFQREIYWLIDGVYAVSQYFCHVTAATISKRDKSDIVKILWREHFDKLN